MTEEMKKKRDELAKLYGTDRFPIQNIETRKDFTQDINFSRRMTHTEAFQAGFDAAYQLMEAENAELKSRIAKLEAAFSKLIKSIPVGFKDPDYLIEARAALKADEGEG